MTHERAVEKAMNHINGKLECGVLPLKLTHVFRCKETWRTGHPWWLAVQG